jgi:hypothetical protein
MNSLYNLLEGTSRQQVNPGEDTYCMRVLVAAWGKRKY